MTQEIFNLVRKTEAIKPRNAEIVYAKLRREGKSHSIRSFPVDRRPNVGRDETSTETIAIASSTVHFQTSAKFFRAKSAVVRTRFASKWPADAPRITKF